MLKNIYIYFFILFFSFANICFSETPVEKTEGGGSPVVARPWGDISGNNKIDLKDAIQILKILMDQKLDPIYGCMDASSLNYNQDATIDDGSCIKKIIGCLDPNATNFNSDANVDSGICAYSKEYYCSHIAPDDPACDSK